MFLLSRSLRRKLVATALSASVIALLYQATVFDSNVVSEGGLAAMEPPAKGTRGAFEATAYCRGTLTASGVAVRAGIAAADPKVLPIGSVIQVDSVDKPYQGIYTILDTGPAVQGREIDIYMWNCNEAVTFGRQDVMVTVLRRGWSSPGRR
jgi:3D (Asp-Asp-Asp) domain-containing protein